MGCCASASTTSPPPPEAPDGGSKSPPPTCPYLQQETVKQVLSETTTFPKPNLHQNGVVFNKPFPLDELSDVDSETTTAVSTPLPEKSQGNAERQQSSPARSNSRSVPGEVKRDKTVGRSPGRRSHPSPNRNRRMNSGESSGRRMRSPDSAGLWKTGMSPARVRFGSSERIRKVEKEEEEITWPPTTSNELLENPLMSLECFIFL